MNENINKLPKWAQWRISRAEKDLADCRKEMDHFAGTEVSEIVIDPDAEMLSRGGRYPRYLSPRTTVQYKLQHGEIEVDLRDGQVRISSSGEGRLIIIPVVSNVLSLTLIEREL